MKSILYGLFLAASFFSAAQAYAQAAASVEGVQMPAWVERNGKRTALLPGMELRAGDQVFTGAGSRALVRLSEGSVVKLGENGTLRFTQIDRSPEIFRAALVVLQGAFRFTTELVGRRKRDRHPRRHPGIRGTYLWGRGRKDNEIVCLIGRDPGRRQGETAQTRTDAVLPPRRCQTQPVGFIDTKQPRSGRRRPDRGMVLRQAPAAARRRARVGADQRTALGLYMTAAPAAWPRSCRAGEAIPTSSARLPARRRAALPTIEASSALPSPGFRQAREERSLCPWAADLHHLIASSRLSGYQC
jgi:hypothetical protein